MKEMATVAQGTINTFMTFDSTKNDLDPNDQEHNMFYLKRAGGASSGGPHLKATELWHTYRGVPNESW